MTLDNRVFAALADPTRRHLLEWLDDGNPATATEFASRLPMSRQAVTKHLKDLEGAGLIVGAKFGRETRYRSHPYGLMSASDWIARRTAAWDDRLARLAALAINTPGSAEQQHTEQ